MKKMYLSYGEYLFDNGYDTNSIEFMLSDEDELFMDYVEHCIKKGFEGDFEEGDYEI